MLITGWLKVSKHLEVNLEDLLAWECILCRRLSILWRPALRMISWSLCILNTVLCKLLTIILLFYYAPLICASCAYILKNYKTMFAIKMMPVVLQIGADLYVLHIYWGKCSKNILISHCLRGYYASWMQDTNVRFLESWGICQVAIDLLQLSIRYLFVLLQEKIADNLPRWPGSHYAHYW